MDAKQLALAIGSVVLIFSGGYATGRYIAPDKVVVTEKVQKVEVEKTVFQDRVKTEVKIVRVQDEKVHLHREETALKWANGTEQKKVVTDQNVEKTVREQDIKYVDRQVVVTQDRVIQVSVDKEKLVERKRPDWRVGVLAGYTVDASGVNLGQQLQHVALGLGVERRIVGPISLGLWGLTSGQGGLSLNMEF